MTNEYPAQTFDDVGWLTEVQMIEVRSRHDHDLHIELIQMMENAGRNLAQLVIDLYSPDTVAVLCGTGGNGGGGLVAARHLANRGVDVTVTLSKPAASLAGAPAHQHDVVQRMGLAVVKDPRPADVTIDALIGYSMKGPPRGRVAELIEIVGDSGGALVALDVPSGLNVTDGSIPGVVVNADATMTVAAPKIGLRKADHVGDLYVADISVPPAVFDAFDAVAPPDFTRSSVVRLLRPARDRL